MSDAVIGIPITQPQGPSAHRPAPTTPSAAENAAKEFESVFLNEMLGPMFEGLSTDGIGGGGDGEQMFRPMLIEQYAAAISKSGGIGLAAAVLRELNHMQGVQHAPGPTAPPVPGSADGADR